MTIKENTLFGVVDKVKIAIARLKEYEPMIGYYLAFSGGKDSQCIYHLAEMAGVKFDAHFSVTTVDPPELIRFIKKYYPSVEFIKPEITMWQLIPKKLMPPTRIMRYCCEKLKEGGGSDRIVVTGIRWAESNKRKKRQIVEQCFKNKHRTFVNPIIDWSDQDVWEFIKSNDLSYCKLYDQGQKRIGCVMCPLQGKDGMLRDMVRWPKISMAYYKAFDNMLMNRKQRDLPCNWETSWQVMEWWIYGKENNETLTDPDQTVMFE